MFSLVSTQKKSGSSSTSILPCTSCLSDTVLCAKKMNEHYADFESAVIHFFDKLEKPWFLDSMVFIETKSAKLLKSLNEFIKEHHYENNYTLRDNWGNRMKTDIDGLLEWWESQTKVKEVA